MRFQCCHKEACEEAIDFAEDVMGVVLERTGHPSLPLMGHHGCTAAPHLRPICTVHVCEQHITPGAWTDRYFELRDLAGEALEDVMLGVKSKKRRTEMAV